MMVVTSGYSHQSTVPSAIRAGISVGVSGGSHEIIRSQVAFGGGTATKVGTWPLGNHTMSGRVADGTSSGRATSAPVAARANAESAKPATKNARNAGISTQTLPGIFALWTAAFVSRPATTAIASWPRPTRPIPTTLPISSWPGLTADSSTSAVREVFSWATPVATAVPYSVIARYINRPTKI